jgi:hypothetical protein
MTERRELEEDGVHEEPYGGIPRAHALRIAAAGPVYTLLLLVACTLFGQLTASGGLAGAIVEANQVMGAYMLVINLAPFRLGELESDGYRIREALPSPS